MSKTTEKTDKKDHLADIDAKLTLLLAIAMCANPSLFEERKSIASEKSVGLLADIGISDTDIAVMLASTKGSVERLRQLHAKKRK